MTGPSWSDSFGRRSGTDDPRPPNGIPKVKVYEVGCLFGGYHATAYVGRKDDKLRLGQRIVTFCSLSGKNVMNPVSGQLTPSLNVADALQATLEMASAATTAHRRTPLASYAHRWYAFLRR